MNQDAADDMDNEGRNDGEDDPRLHSLQLQPPHDCAYLPNRQARTRAAYARRLDPEVYHELMDAGCRRSGLVIYRPACEGCRACVPLRVPVNLFQPNRSQRRCRTRNSDLAVEVGRPVCDDESFDLYMRYQRDWHGSEFRDDETAAEARESFERFLIHSPLETIQMRYRAPDGRLLAFGTCDVSRRSLSSVYFVHDPAERRRGLGTFGALVEIDWALSHNIQYYYLGYWVDGCDAMKYKRLFQPCELLVSHQWQQIS